jgi:glycosyltransferase involved in cell wall biosynthesis
MILVSVIIPTYGRPIYLGKAILSVLNQSIEELELIIVDDNNPNTTARIETQNIINKYTDKRIVYIKHDYNKNGAAARNTGIKVARGEFISFLDSDDEYMPDRLKLCCQKINNYDNNVAGVYTGCEFRKGGKKYHTETKIKSGSFLINTLAGNFKFCTGSNLFIRKSVINELNGFDETFIRHQDYEFLVRLFLKYSLVAINDVLVVKNNENFNLPDARKMIKVKQLYLEKYKFIIDTIPICKKKYIFSTHYISIAESLLRCGEINEAHKFYRKASKLQHISIKNQLRRVALLIANAKKIKLNKPWKQ